MECNIKKRFFSVFLLLFPILVWSEPGILTGTVDVTRTLKDFQAGSKLPPTANHFIIEGSVGSVYIQDSDPEAFVAIVELVQAEWENPNEIKDFKGYMVFKGKSFVDKVLEKRSKILQPEEVSPHRRLLVAAQFTGMQEIEPGKPVPVFLVNYYRTLD